MLCPRPCPPTAHCCSVGGGAWVQQGARVMPGVAMGAAARLLPACTVLPGEALGEGTLWGGGVPASPQGRYAFYTFFWLVGCAAGCTGMWSMLT